MATDSGSSGADLGARLVSSDLIQRAMLILSVAVGTAYVAGYVARSSYLASLGLGFFSNSREALVGTGVGLIVNALPAAYTLWYWGIFFPQQVRKGRGVVFGVLGYGFLCTVLLAITNMFMLRDDGGPGWQGELIMALSVLPGFVVLWLLGLTPVVLYLFASKEKANRQGLLAFGSSILFVPYALIYGQAVLPFCNSTFGGLVLEEVTVRYKGETGEVKRLLIDSDDKVAILGVNLTPREYLNTLHKARADQSVERVAWDEISVVRRPPVNR